MINGFLAVWSTFLSRRLFCFLDYARMKKLMGQYIFIQKKTTII
jgi:hypothetical protein